MCPVLLTIDGSVIKVTDSVHDLVIILRVDMFLKDQIVHLCQLLQYQAAPQDVCKNNQSEYGGATSSAKIDVSAI